MIYINLELFASLYLTLPHLPSSLPTVKHRRVINFFTEAKLREIIATLLKAGLDREDDSGRKLKATVLPPFPSLGQEDIFDANDN